MTENPGCSVSGLGNDGPWMYIVSSSDESFLDLTFVATRLFIGSNQIWDPQMERNVFAN